MFTGRLSGGSEVTSRPRSSIRPPVGRSNPPIIRSVVVLPQPEGPRSEKNSPASSVSETSSTARTSRYCFTRFERRISGTAWGAGDAPTIGAEGTPARSGSRPTPAILDGMADDGRPPAAGSKTGLVVALDGPASSGKSSVGAAAAAKLGYRFCDTGLLYRAVTWLALHRGVDAGDPAGLVGLVDEIHLLDDGTGRLAHVAVDDVDRTAEVREPEVDVAVSAISGVAELRSALLARQRELASDGRIVMAGRDIGTVVLPDADLKLFLEASVEERAGRRALERGIAPDSAEGQEILAELRRRDHLDSSRPVAPLRRPDDAVVIRTDGNA